MVPITKKVSLEGRGDLTETEGGSGGYFESSEDSLVEEEGNVSDYEGKDPKEAPEVCFFSATECRKIFRLKGDDTLEVDRVCGGTFGSCIRAGHGASDRPVGDIGWYSTIKTFRKVDGILATHQTKEDYARVKAEAKALRNSHLSILAGSSAYAASLKQVHDELGNSAGMPDGTGTPDSMEGWEQDLDDTGSEVIPRRGRSKGDQDQKRASRKTAPAPAPKMETIPNEVLLQALLILTEKVDAMERKTSAAETRNNRPTKPARHVAPSDDDEADEASDGTMEELRPRQSKGVGGSSGARRSTRPAEPGPSDSEPEEPRTYKPVKRSAGKKGSLPKPTGSKFYAVARGRTPGVYSNWDEARSQVIGFSGAVHKRFATKQDARAYVTTHRANQYEEEWDESPGPSGSEGELASETEGRRPTHRSREKVSHPSPKYMAPDPSIGKPKEFFGMTVTDARTMTNTMSPPGVEDYETRKLLAGATLDAVQLPGRCSATVDNDPGSVAEAIAELAEDKRGEWAGDGPRRDVQWKAASRTSLKSITSHDALQERLSELQGLKGDTYENQVHSFRAILADLHWSETSILAWAQLNWYQRIGLDTLENYLNLHRHLIDISLKHGWEYAAISLTHHTTKLAHIRAQAPSRLSCMVRIYIYLRDANQQSFYSEKLQEKRNKEVMEELVSLKTLGLGSPASTCSKCGMTAHPGGTKNCPLKALSDQDARRKVKFVWEQLGKMQQKDWERVMKAEE